MRKCSSCLRSTFDSAKFCHHCGAKMGKQTLDCPDCNHANLLDAKVCENCDFDFFAPAPSPISSNKKKSIFADIQDEIEENTMEKEAIAEDAEEEPALIFESPVAKDNLKEKEDSKIKIEKAEEIEEFLELSFENPIEETPDSILKKANIPFEIVENPIDEQADSAIATASDEEIDDPIIEPVDLIEDAEIEEEISNIIDDEIEELELEEPSPINNLFEENPNDSVEEEIFKKFADAFEKQIKNEQNPAKYNAYVDRFEASDFKLSFEFRVKQLAEEIQKIRQEKSDLLQDETILLERAFTELTDYFIIRYCKDLNRVHLSENILQYQNIPPENIDLSNLILDYLDFENENERVNFDFIKMPLKRLQNASKSYLFPEKGEKIFFICDQTMLGSGKEGFAMTEKAIYWKMQFESPERVYYKNLKSVEPQKDWIVINEMFFNANSSLNIKMMKLLRKLKTII